MYKVAVHLPMKLYLLHVLTINTGLGQIKELQLNFTQVQVSDCQYKDLLLHKRNLSVNSYG